MTTQEAYAAIVQWRNESPAPACNFYWPGRFNMIWGEALCMNCRAPKSVHEAQRVLAGKAA